MSRGARMALLAVVVAALALVLAGCGDDGDDPAAPPARRRPRRRPGRPGSRRSPWSAASRRAARSGSPPASATPCASRWCPTRRTSCTSTAWVGLAAASALFGDVFRAFNPWRAVARAAAWIAGRTRRSALPEPLEYPPWLGHWPAVAGLAAFAWLELVATDGNNPQLLAILAMVYAAVQFVGMALFGIERWNDRGDAFGVYFNLFARLSPFERRGRDLFLVRPLSRVTGLVAVPGTLTLLFVMIGSTSFDGASEGELWGAIAPALQDPLESIGIGQTPALEITLTIGLALSILVIAGVYRIGVSGMRSVGKPDSAELSRRFTHTLVPIALAYVIAHYFSLLHLPRPGSAVTSSRIRWATGRTSSAGDAHDRLRPRLGQRHLVRPGRCARHRARRRTRSRTRPLVDDLSDARLATRSQYWMLAVMVGYTSLGLWLLSAVTI